MSGSRPEIPSENIVPADPQSTATDVDIGPAHSGEVEAVEPSSSTSERKKSSSERSYQIRLGIALALPVFLETLDYTVVATAQPHIASTFNRLDLQSYVGTVYVLTSTVFLPIFASLADIFGRHWALQLSMFFFLLGSAISTGAQNITMLLAGRAIAGIGAAGLVTVVRVILADSRSLNTNNIQTGIIVLLYAIGYSVGPYIGGALTNISFRWVFAINLPCTVASMVLGFILLRGHVKPAQVRHELEHANRNDDHETTKPSLLENFQRVDILGAFFFIGGGILILLGLNWGSTAVWHDAKVIATLVIGGLLAVAFVLWEWFADRPFNDERREGANGTEKVAIKHRNPRPYWFQPETMIPLEVFKNYDVCATQLAAFSSGMVMLVNFYFLAIFFTIVLNQSANQAGAQLIYFAPGIGAGTFISILMIKIFRQPKYAIILGSFVVPVGLGLLSFAMQRNNQHLADAFLVVCGAGGLIGLSFGPLATQARFSQPESRVAIVIGLNLFFRTFGGTVGLAQCSAVMNAKVRTIITDLARSGTLTPAEIAQVASLGDISSIQAIAELPSSLQRAVRDAFREGVRLAFISLIPWTGIAAIMVLFLSKIPDSDLQVLHGGVKDRGSGDPPAEGAPAQEGSSNTMSRPKEEEKVKIYGPITLIIYLVKIYLRKRREAQARARAAAAEEVAGADVSLNN